MYFFFPNCILVKGYKSSAIYDIFRFRYKKISTELADILLKNENKILNENDFQNEDLLEIINILKNEDYLYIISSNINLIIKEIPKYFNVPNFFKTCVFNLTVFPIFDLEKAIHKLEEVGVDTVLFNISDEITAKTLILEVSKITKLLNIDYIAFSVGKSFRLDKDLIEIINNNYRISDIYTKNNINKTKLKKCNIIQINSNEYKDLFAVKNKFRVNLSNYCEAQKYNLFYNKKFFIDSYGKIYANT